MIRSRPTHLCYVDARCNVGVASNLALMQRRENLSDVLGERNKHFGAA